jgi:acetoin utilization deacetylase AcuC-like enzyme
MGFCFFKSRRGGGKRMITHNQATRVLIVDWDVPSQQDAKIDAHLIPIFSICRCGSGLRQASPAKFLSLRTGRSQRTETQEWQQHNIEWTAGHEQPDYAAAFWQLVLPLAANFQPTSSW